ncbi:MAG: sigma 54-interacting transcriptional regulator [Myxococcota bacterium]
MSDLTTTDATASDPTEGDGPHPLALAIVFSVQEPERAGEIAWLQGKERVLGRDGDLEFLRHRPRERTGTGPMRDHAVSRRQLVLRPLSPQRVTVERVGRLTLRVNGVPVDEAELRAGDVLELGERAVLVVHERPEILDGVRPRHAFGEADPQGFVGEGAAAWALRARVTFVARRNAHVMVHGESGTGKELVARAVHMLSTRSRAPLVSRSAATIPESLADAELFGNLVNYPNPGMPMRPGLVGEADGGVLFLDEFGELPIELQARLLRVLDAGEYTRLGEAKPRRADLRLVAATNRPLGDLKHDVLARIPLRVSTPSLAARREDVGLLIVHLLRRIAREDAEIAHDLFPEGDPAQVPRVTTRLVATLTAHPYRTHLRELTALLWSAIGEHAPGRALDVFSGYSAMLDAPAERPIGAVDPSALTAEVVQACLDRNGGRQELAWRELGLSSRHVLGRLVRKYNLRVRGRGGG